MKIIDKALLATPRSLKCEYCGHKCKYPTERHHIVFRGLGGGSRLDLPENLIDLGGAFDCQCHIKAGAGKITKLELFAITGKKVCKTAVEVEEYLNRVRNLPKGSEI